MSRGRGYTLAAALLLVAIGVALLSARGSEPPPDRAAGLVPADAFLYLHLAAEGQDEQQERAAELVERVQGLRRLRDGLLQRASASGGDIDFGADVRPWLGEEAAAALVGPAPDEARSLLVLEADDEEGARAFMDELAGPDRSTYRDTEILGGSDVASALVDGFVLVGPVELIRQALDVRAGAGPALAGNSAYVELRDGLPVERLVHAYTSKPGLEALLAGQAAALSGLPGVAELSAGALAFSVSDERAQLSFRGSSAPGGGGCTRPAGDDPPAADQAPAASLLYAEAPDGACLVRELVASPDSGAGAALRRLGSSLRDEADVDLADDVLPLLAGLTTLTLTREGEEPPVATLRARGPSSGEALSVLNRLQPALVRLAEAPAVAPAPGTGGEGQGPGAGPPDGTGPGRAPGFEVQDVGGVSAVTAALAPGIQLSYASLEDSFVVSTALDGIAHAAAPEAGLAGTGDFGTLLGDRAGPASAVVFLDVDKLFALGDQIGLAEAPGYATARDDLQAIGAAAVVFSREGDQTKAELLFKAR